MINIKKKIVKIFLSSSIGCVALGLIVLIPILMLLDFFGANVTDGYVENNSQYAELYKPVVRSNLINGNGYASLDRILYFYLENDNLTFIEIYQDNLDQDLKQVKPISDVCEMDKYKNYSVCKLDEISESGQINEIQNKPFSSPLDFKELSVTSFFMEERIIYGEANTHSAWDFGASAETPISDAILSIVSLTFFGSFLLPRSGSGERYGASVSTKILSSGKSFKNDLSLFL